MYSIRQAADLIGVQPKVIRRLLGEGRLPGAVRIDAKHGGQTWRISPEALETLRQFSRGADEEPQDVQAPTAVLPPIVRAVQVQTAGSAPAQVALSEAEIVARHMAPVAAALNGGQPLLGKEHLVPMSVVVELLRSEADQRRQAQRMAEDQANTVALLRQSIEIDRDEILRLRVEVIEIRQELQQAQRGLLRLQSKPMPSVDHERVTMPLDPETLQRIAAMN